MNNYATLIPTRSRPQSLLRMFSKCKVLNSTDTYVGIEKQEEYLYKEWRTDHGDKCNIVWISNPEGMHGNAREPLRKAACEVGYKRYFSTDDNSNFSVKSLENLLLASEIEPDSTMSGIGQPPLWHAKNISEGNKYNLNGREITTFEAFSTVHWVIPDFLYSEFEYPKDCFNDDVYFALWCISKKKFYNFRMCLEAPFSKKRFELGGNGTSQERLKKMALGMYQLASDFPDLCSHEWMKTHFNWKSIIENSKETK